MLANQHDQYVGRALIDTGEYSPQEITLLCELVPVGGTVVEAGANIGALTVPLAQHVGPSGAVICFEPQRYVFQLLNANIALNSLLNVRAVQAALGSERGRVHVPVLDPTTPANFGGLDIRGHQEGEQVAVAMVDELNLRRLDLLKADVEGMELDVLNGAREAIVTHRPALYLEVDRPGQREALCEWLRPFGYRFWMHRPPLFGNLVSINLLAIHESRELPDATDALGLSALVKRGTVTWPAQP